MNCSKCGTTLKPTDKFCLSCGTPVLVPNPQQVNQPPTNFGGAPMGNQMPNNQSNGKLIITIVAIISVTAIVIALMFILLGNKDEKETNGGGTTIENNGGNTGGNNGGTVPVTEDPAFTIKYGKFTIGIPEGYQYQYADDYVQIANSEYYIEMMAIENATFATATEEQLKTAISQTDEFTYKSSETKTVDGKKYIVMYVQYQGIDCAYVFDQNSYNYAAVTFGYALDYSLDAGIIDEMIYILANTKYDATANIENSMDIDHSKLIDFE